MNILFYVVIGAFSIKDNAVTLAQREKAGYEINQQSQLYYVFVLKTEDHDQALAEAIRLQKTTHADAWVYSRVPAEKRAPGPALVEAPVEPEAAAQESPSAVPAADKNNDKSKTFFFKVVYESGSPANGAEVTLIEPKSQRTEYVVKGNENTTIKAINQTGDIRLECDLVGYRKIIQTINFKDPTSIDGVAIEKDRIVVPFTLVRLKKGDYSILYNVFFYKDAAIMRPESKFDLDGLLDMMNENPKYKIRIHGHTNGNASGKIMEVGESGEFFSLTGAKEGNGSAKKLSLKRAEVIRNYLATKGVDPTRMETKAWGGKKPIYDKHHTQASANVRVEVEVIEE
jgi:outer membrane protein OmpA-like peptidoglycan-associated protein